MTMSSRTASYDRFDVADTPETRAWLAELNRDTPELLRRYAITRERTLARFPWVVLDVSRPVGRFHEVGDGLALCVHEIAAVTGRTLRVVRSRVRRGVTGRALILVGTATPFEQ